MTQYWGYSGRSIVLLSLVVLAFLTGCARVPRSFPIGLYDVPPDQFPTVAAAGFNTVIAPASRAMLDAAQTNDIQVIAHVSLTAPEQIRAIRHHPALSGWYLFDEPDLHLLSPRAVGELNSQLHRLSEKPSLVVLTSGAAVEKYRGSADLIGVDWYPVPWAPVATIAREMRLARVAAGQRPFYAVVQAFDWKIATNLLRTDVPLRPPTREEIRCMTYLALAQGASGILFYTYDIKAWKLREHPELWDAISELALELQQNSSIFSHRINWWPVETRSYGAPTAMYNEIVEARVLLNLYYVSKPAGLTRAGYYLVAINTSATPTDFSFKLPFAGIQTFESTCASGSFTSEDGWLRKTYAPFEVCILGPINAPLLE